MYIKKPFWVKLPYRIEKISLILDSVSNTAKKLVDIVLVENNLGSFSYITNFLEELFLCLVLSAFIGFNILLNLKIVKFFLFQVLTHPFDDVHLSVDVVLLSWDKDPNLPSKDDVEVFSAVL